MLRALEQMPVESTPQRSCQTRGRGERPQRKQLNFVLFVV